MPAECESLLEVPAGPSAGLELEGTISPHKGVWSSVKGIQMVPSQTPLPGLALLSWGREHAQGKWALSGAPWPL